MAEILDGLIDYIPKKEISNGNAARIPRIIYGDQLTIVHIRGAVTLRSSDLVEEKHLNGFVEVVSDWHTRLCLVTVCTVKIYKLFVMDLVHGITV